jgi:hypothetical protein
MEDNELLLRVIEEFEEYKKETEKRFNRMEAQIRDTKRQAELALNSARGISY